MTDGSASLRDQAACTKAPHCQNFAIGTIRAAVLDVLSESRQMQNVAKMSNTAEDRASEILRHLGGRLPDATLEYEHVVEIHKFVIRHASLVYRLTVPDSLLRSTALEELKRTIAPVVDRILLGVAPHRIWVGVWAAYATV